MSCFKDIFSFQDTLSCISMCVIYIQHFPLVPLNPKSRHLNPRLNTVLDYFIQSAFLSIGLVKSKQLQPKPGLLKDKQADFRAETYQSQYCTVIQPVRKVNTHRQTKTHMKEEQRPTLKALPPSVRKWVNNLYLSTLCWSKRSLTPAVNEKAGQCILFPFPKMQ